MARIVVVGPHPDDQELGMGGTIARLASQGHHLLLLDMTNGEPTPLGSPEIRKAETAAATKILSPDPAEHPGSVPITRMLLGLTNREVQHTLEARHRTAAVFRAWQADMVFTTYPVDAHPDHRAVTRIVEDARFDSKLSKITMPAPVDLWTGATLEGPGVEDGGKQTRPCHPKWLFYYYATHLRWVADPSFVFDITGCVDTKIDAIRAYHTQFVLPEKNRKVVDWVAASAVYFGSRIGTDAGEPFHTREPVGLNSLASLAI
ncbi:MAG: bacillithiol biosynthesis deacetylase BshB1 [Planctomycetota bacterium]|nr:MAG: bacillithiol biosynthesis deacetylase BshB1 [Planctomycetota bacterium]